MADTHNTRRPRITVRPQAPRHGEMVVLSLHGLDPREQVTVKAVATETDDIVHHEVRTDAHGRIDTALRLPETGREMQPWTFTAAGADGDVRMATPPILVMPRC